VPSVTSRLGRIALGLAIVACSTDPGAPPLVGGRVIHLEKAGGDHQAGVVGQELPNDLEVRVVDADGAVVRDQAVHFAIHSGEGSVTPTVSQSDASGIVRARWRLGPAPATAHQVSARLVNATTGALVDVVTFAATATAGSATTIAKVSGDFQFGRVRTALPAPFVVVVHDQFGNPKPAAPVTWAVVTGDGSPSTSATWTDSRGRTQIRFTLGPVEGPQTVRASLASGQGVTFAATAFAEGALQGIVERTDPLSSRPYAVAISATDVVYVTQLDNQRLSRIDLPALGEAASVQVGRTPTDISFNASGTRAYVANQLSQNIGVVDVATNSQNATIAVIGDPFEVIPNADDTRLYVVTNANRLYELDPASGSVVRSLPLPGTGQSLAFHPNGYLLYVSTFSGGSALEVDTRSMTVTRTFVTGGLAQEVVVSRDGAELFVADQTLQKVDVFSLGTGARLASIPVGGSAWGMAMTPDGTQLYVGLLFQGQVAVIDRAARTVVQRIVTGGVPRRIVFDQAGTVAVVANENGYVTYIR
jgi:YVTN family beta-propeller protein